MYLLESALLLLKEHYLFVFLFVLVGSMLAFAILFFLPSAEDNTTPGIGSDQGKPVKGKAGKSLRAEEPVLDSQLAGYVREFVDRLVDAKLFSADKTVSSLQMAGYRSSNLVVLFVFYKLISVCVCSGIMLFLLFFIFSAENLLFSVSLFCGSIAFGWYLPNILLSVAVRRRQRAFERGWPDALDLLLIGVEAGLSLEGALQRVVEELNRQSDVISEELAIMLAELSFLQDRRQAYENLAARTGLSSVKSTVTTLVQSARFGTPIAQALRVMAQSSREERMYEIERKAASLPPKLTIPMIVFFLPVLFIIILGPAIIRVFDIFG